ncbi:MAG: type VII toxin-antitoxin system HepT family RNase toxin [Thermoanaerobaculia bacterium]
MTDPELIAKKLGQIETCLRELETLARLDRIRQDVREQRFVEHTLQLAIQAALDVASHIVSDERLGEPRTNRELFDLLERSGWVSPDLAGTLRRMVGFRNVLVHGYDTVDLDVVEDVMRNRLADLRTFVAVIRWRLPDG